MAFDKPKIRWIVAIIFLFLTVGMIIYTIRSYTTLDIKEGIDDIPYNALTKAAIDGKKDISENLFEIGLLLLAALWGLLIAKKEESGIVLSKNPELIAFVCASLLLLFSLVSHILYLKALMTGFADSGLAFTEAEQTIINIFDKKFNYFFISQVSNLIAGAVMAIVTLLSAHKFND